MTVEGAFKLSAGWVFMDLSKRIVRERYLRYLALCNYSNKKHVSKAVDFWNFGPLTISPRNNSFEVQILKQISYLSVNLI